MRHGLRWVLAGLVVLGCGGVDSLGDPLDDEWAPVVVEQPMSGDEPFAEDEVPCSAESWAADFLDPEPPVAADVGPQASTPGVFIVERIDGDDGEPLLSDEFLFEEP